MLSAVMDVPASRAELHVSWSVPLDHSTLLQDGYLRYYPPDNIDVFAVRFGVLLGKPAIGSHRHCCTCQDDIGGTALQHVANLA